MIKKVSLGNYRITPLGWRQHILALFFQATGSITCFGSVLLTKNKQMVKWFL